MTILSFKKQRIRWGRRLANKHRPLVIDAHSDFTFTQAMGIRLLGGVDRLNRRSLRRAVTDKAEQLHAQYAQC